MDILNDIELLDCPICHGAGLLEEENGWCLYVSCLDCGCHTAEVSFKTPEEKLKAAQHAAEPGDTAEDDTPLFDGVKERIEEKRRSHKCQKAKRRNDQHAIGHALGLFFFFLKEKDRANDEGDQAEFEHVEPCNLKAPDSVGAPACGCLFCADANACELLVL